MNSNYMQTLFQQKTQMDCHSKPMEVQRFSFYKSQNGKRLFQVIDEGPEGSFYWLKEFINGLPGGAIQTQAETFHQNVKEGKLINVKIQAA